MAGGHMGPKTEAISLAFEAVQSTAVRNGICWSSASGAPDSVDMSHGPRKARMPAACTSHARGACPQPQACRSPFALCSPAAIGGSLDRSAKPEYASCMAVASTTIAHGPRFSWAREIAMPPACITTNFPNLHAQASPTRQANHHTSPTCSHARLPPLARR